MQKALDLPFLSDSQAVERKIGIDGTDYLLRLLEVPIDDVDIDDDDETVIWPETIEDKLMPQIDGAVTLYNVQDRGTLEDVPKMLSTFYLTDACLFPIICTSKQTGQTLIRPSEQMQSTRLAFHRFSFPASATLYPKIVP